MANQIPLQSGIPAAGGVLVPQELGEILINGFVREAAALQLASIERIDTNRMTWPVYLGRPTAGFVGEGASKPVTGAEYTEVSASIKKMATGVIYTDEVLEDARINPEVLINPDVEGAFADLIDANIIGTHPGGASVQAFLGSSFADDAGAAAKCLGNTSSSIELGTGQDALATAISAAIEVIEGNGYQAGGMMTAFDMKGHLRGARDVDGRPLYTDGFQREPDSLYGLGLSYTTNLDGFPAGLLGGAASHPKIAAIVGDFSRARVIVRKDMRVSRHTEGTYQGHNLLETNKTLVKWELRMGFFVQDLNRAFVKIVNAT